MKLTHLSVVLAAIAGLILCASSFVPAAVTPDVAQKLYDQITPSLVAVQFTWESEMGRREIIGAGVVISDDGLVVGSIGVFNAGIPDEQMKDFKIIVPQKDADEEELDAVFVGRDERTNLAFLKTKEPQKWHAIKFEDRALKVGEPILSVGILPKSAGYRPYLTQSAVSGFLRGEVPSVLVTGGLAALGSPVFTEDGKAVGLVTYQPDTPIILNDPRDPLKAVTSPPCFFVPTRDFVQSFTDLPTAGQPLKLPWVGLPQLTGMKKDIAEFYGLKNQPAIEIGDVIPNAPGDKAGLKRGMVITKINGQPLERGDEPDELPAIIRRKQLRMKVGEKVVYTVIPGKGKPPQDITITLEEQPKRPNLAKRYFAEDLGFTAREITFGDTYQRKLAADIKGVLISFVKPSSSALSARLQNGDLVTEMNSKPVTDVDQFKADYLQFRKDKPKEAVVLVVMREGNTQVIRIEPPQ